jgi:3-methyladenine DNA glycosylase AlkD
MSHQDVIDHLQGLSDPVIAEHSQRFFKTAEGEYGHGDIFLGIRVPAVRRAVRTFRHIPLPDVKSLLASGFHEVRLFALLLLVDRYARTDEAGRIEIYDLYLKQTRHINNWDLVDGSAPGIVGAHLQDRDRSALYRLAASSSLWERRIAVMATFHFIRRGQFRDTLRIAELLLDDPQDLIHKATGWMLREVGNRDQEIEKAFLRTHYARMPRTMLRYAIEKFNKEERLAYLNGSFRNRGQPEPGKGG